MITHQGWWKPNVAPSDENSPPPSQSKTDNFLQILNWLHKICRHHVKKHLSCLKTCLDRCQFLDMWSYKKLWLLYMVNYKNNIQSWYGQNIQKCHKENEKFIKCADSSSHMVWKHQVILHVNFIHGDSGKNLSK
jgi:hypothetical protein